MGFANPLATLPGAINQTAAIVEGDALDIQYSHSAVSGPRTVVKLANLSTIAGTFTERSVTLQYYGGPVPDGGFMQMAHAVRWVAGGHYIVFLRRGEWTYTPVVDEWVLRATEVAGQRVWTTISGALVRGVQVSGIEETVPVLDVHRTSRTGLFKTPLILEGAKSDGAMDVDAVRSRIKLLATSEALAGVFVPTPREFPAPTKVTPMLKKD